MTSAYVLKEYKATYKVLLKSGGTYTCSLFAFDLLSAASMYAQDYLELLSVEYLRDVE